MNQRTAQNAKCLFVMRRATIVALLVLIGAGQVEAVILGAIPLPGSSANFADLVIEYDPLHSGGPGPTIPTATDADDALGIPDFPPGGGVGTPGAVSLGHGGLLELLFADVLMTNTGDSASDLYIIEVGPDVEDTFVGIRPTAFTAALLGSSYDSNNDGFYEVGKVLGSTSFVDIDAFFPGFARATLYFDAIQLFDDINEGNVSGRTVGADIDAVWVIPEPATIFLLGLGGLTVLGKRRR